MHSKSNSLHSLEFTSSYQQHHDLNQSREQKSWNGQEYALMAQACWTTNVISTIVFEHAVILILWEVKWKPMTKKPNMHVKNKPQKENTEAKNSVVFFQTSCQGQWVLLKGEPLPHFMPDWVKTDMSMY